MGASGKTLRILLVEDDDSDRAIFALAVKRSSSHVTLHAVPNGQIAIDYLEGKNVYADREQYPLPHLIVLDLSMPILDGFEFLKYRSTSAFAALPVIVLEGSGRSEYLDQAVRLGAMLSLTKPVRFDAYCRMVGTMIASIPSPPRAEL